MKFLIFIGLNVGGSIGWWAGDFVGLWTAFFASGLGSILGIYAGWWVARENLV